MRVTLGEKNLSTVAKVLVALFALVFVTGCSSPRDRFIDAAMEGKEKNKKEISPLEANLKLIAKLTVANLACKI
jgi:hypothetical protein